VEGHGGVDTVEDDARGLPAGEVFVEVAAGGEQGAGDGFVGADVGDVVAYLVIGEPEGFESSGGAAVGVFEVEDGDVFASLDGLYGGVEGDPGFA
jgi:hypothetical protein